MSDLNNKVLCYVKPTQEGKKKRKPCGATYEGNYYLCLKGTANGCPYNKPYKFKGVEKIGCTNYQILQTLEQLVVSRLPASLSTTSDYTLSRTEVKGEALSDSFKIIITYKLKKDSDAKIEEVTETKREELPSEKARRILARIKAKREKLVT
jgi:hypothetical protein